MPPRCSLAALEPSLLHYPLSVLNLTVRACNCLSHVPSLSALLAYPETQLMRQRHFGRTSLADVRRRIVHFCVDHLGVGVAHPIRVALYDPHPAVAAIWQAPPQARSLAEVVDELLDVLSRPEELRAAGSWSYSSTAIGPPRPISLAATSLVEVIDSFFHLLRDRERRMVEMRYGPADGAGATLAEIGSTFGLTRERVRQILHVSLQRLASEEERRRRLALTEFVREAITRSGGLIRERDLIAELRDSLQPPHAEAGPFVRALLESEPGWVPAGQGVWASAEVSLAGVARMRESFRVALRAAGRPLHRDELLAAARGAGACPPALVLGCLKSDDRLSCRDGERFALVEWEWLLPQTVDDYIYLALRAAGRARHYLWITEYVNTLVPSGEEVTPREIHSTLLDRTERFRRVREGTYGLVEAHLPRTTAQADEPVGRGSEDRPAHGRSAALTGTSTPPPTPIGATAERVGAAR